MQTLNRAIKKHSALIILGTLLVTFSPAWANSDMQMMEKALKAREGRKHKAMDHSAHEELVEATSGFRGVFYGYLPCRKDGCDGIKMTLSLTQKNNYLLVTQYAQSSNREYFEKGKYDWDDQNRRLTLTPRKKAPQRQFKIENDATLVQLNSDGTLPDDLEDYSLQRSDSIKTRQVHIH